MPYPIIITAVDKATETIERIKSRVASVTAPVARLQKSFERLANATGLSKLAKGFDRIARFSLRAFQSVARIVAPLGIITGALSVAGLAKMVDGWSHFAQSLGFTAQRIGVTSGQLQGLEGAARLAGGSAGALDSSLKSLTDNITDAIGGRNSEALLYFNTLGITIADANGHARDTAEIFPQIADKIAAIKNPALQARVAVALLGGSAEELLPFLRRGSAGIQELTQAAERYGVTNAKAVAAADDLRLAQTKLELAVQGLANSIAVALAPVLGPLLTQFADWIAQNREWIAVGIGEKVQELGKFIQSIDWHQVGDGINAFGADLKAAADAVGGFSHVVEILFGLWAASKVASVLLSIRKLALGIGGLVTAVTGVPGWLIALLAGGGVASQVYGDKVLGPQIADQVKKTGGFVDPNTGMFIPLDAAGSPASAARPKTPALPKAAGLPRGLRDNNPLNLEYRNQIGTVGNDGRYGVYESMEAGIAAAGRQLLRYQERYGLTTVAQMISRWAPASENNKDAYIADVAKRGGLDPNAQVSMRDPAVAQSILAAMAHHENGRDVDVGVLAQGVSMALGKPVAVGGGAIGAAPTAPTATLAPQKGTLDVTIRNLSSGSSISAVTKGNAITGALRVENAMPGYAR